MKKNTKTYLLLALVVSIWGLIGYKLLNAANPQTMPKADLTLNEMFVPKQVKKRDTFSIAANYRDPFLGTAYAPKKIRKSTPKISKKIVPQKVISYSGFITDKESKQKIFFVTIDGQQQMMGVNDTFKEVKLVYGTKSKIKIRYKGSTRTIALTE